MKKKLNVLQILMLVVLIVCTNLTYAQCTNDTDTCLTTNDKIIWNIVVNKKQHLEELVKNQDSIIILQKQARESFVKQLELKNSQLLSKDIIIKTCELELKQSEKEIAKYKKKYYIAAGIAAFEFILITILIIQ